MNEKDNLEYTILRLSINQRTDCQKTFWTNRFTDCRVDMKMTKMHLDVNELPTGVLSFPTICVPFLRTPWMKKCVPLTSKSAYPRRGTQNIINVRVLKVRLLWAADQTLPIPDIRKTLQVLSCKVCGGDSWTRTNVRSFNRRTDALERRLYSFRANKLKALPASQDSPPG